MSKTHAHILAEGVTDCGWNQDTQKLLCLDYISIYLGSEGLVKLQAFLYDVANYELLEESKLQSNLEEVVAEIVAGGSGKYTSPEEILDSIGDITGWNESTKFQFVCRFLDKHYSNKIELFETIIQQIIADESTEYPV
jgi:hypothetical protein